MAFFISHVISTRGAHIRPRAAVPRDNMVRGLIWDVIWKLSYHNLLVIYPVVTSARSCNKVGHLFWFTILAQHETNESFCIFIAYINTEGILFNVKITRWDYNRSLNWKSSMQVKKILFTNVFFSWSLCLLNMFPSMVFPKHFYFSGLLT